MGYKPEEKQKIHELTPMRLFLSICVILLASNGMAEPETLSVIKERLKAAEFYQDESETTLKEILQVEPGNGEARFLLGELYRQKEMWWEAIEQYEFVIEKRPQDVRLRWRLGQCHVKVWNTEDAMAHISKAIELAKAADVTDFPFGEAYFDLASAYQQNEEYEAAILYYEQAAALGYDPLKMRYFIGECHYYLKDFESAREAFNDILFREPAYPDAHTYLGIILREEEKYAEAMEEFKKDLLVQPLDANVYHWLAYTAEALKDTEGAVGYYEKMIEVGEELKDDARQNLGRIFIEGKDYKQAIYHLEAIDSHYFDRKRKRRINDLLVQAYVGSRDYRKAVEIVAKDPSSVFMMALATAALLLPGLTLFIRGRNLLSRFPLPEGEERAAMVHGYQVLLMRLQTGAFVGLLISLGPPFPGVKAEAPWWILTALVMLLMLVSSMAVYLFFVRRMRQAPLGLTELLVNYIKWLLSVASLFAFFAALYQVRARFPAGILYDGLQALIASGIMVGYYHAFCCLVLHLNRRIEWSDIKLRNELTSLARNLNIPCKGIYIIKTDHFRLANAMAAGISKNSQCVIFFSYLLDVLDRKQLQAIFLHELGHLKYRHVAAELLCWVAFFFSIMLVGLIPKSHDFFLRFIIYFSPIVIFVYAIGWLRKRNEFVADRFAVAHCVDPEIYVTALQKLYAANDIPAKAKFGTHPSLEQRIKSIRQSVPKA